PLGDPLELPGAHPREVSILVLLDAPSRPPDGVEVASLLIVSILVLLDAPSRLFGPHLGQRLAGFRSLFCWMPPLGITRRSIPRGAISGFRSLFCWMPPLGVSRVSRRPPPH